MEDIDKRIAFIAGEERKLLAEREKFVSQNEPIFKRLEVLDVQIDELQKMKKEVKDALVAKGDFDLHKVDGVKVSVANIARVAVADIDKVPEDFKSTQVVVDEKRAQEYLKVMGKVPDGFINKSYQRFSWKDEKEK